MKGSKNDQYMYQLSSKNNALRGFNIILIIVILDTIRKQSPACTKMPLKKLSQWLQYNHGHSFILPLMSRIKGLTDYSLSKSLFDKTYLTIISNMDI